MGRWSKWHSIENMLEQTDFATTTRLCQLRIVDKAGLDWIGPPELTAIANSWPEIIDTLKTSHGDKAKVAVIPDATLQYFPGLWREA